MRSGSDIGAWVARDLEGMRDDLHALYRDLHAHPELVRMRVLQRGNRLSVMPVDPAEWAFIGKLAAGDKVSHALKPDRYAWLHVAEGELVTLIGSNGAGKTTTMKAITGTLAPQSGSIDFCGASILRQDTWNTVAQGMAMVPEGRGVFSRMTITENLQMGAYIVSGQHQTAQIRADIDAAFTTFPRLKERKDQLAGTLSGGEQQMLAMARALMSRPKMLLLDEPSMGLSPLMVEKIFDVVREVRSQGVTVLLVEQNAKLALQIADRAYVMESGLITMSGQAKDLLDDPRVRAAYLGE